MSAARLQGRTWAGKAALCERHVGETAARSALRHILSAKQGKYSHLLQGGSGPRTGAKLGSQQRGCGSPSSLSRCPLGDTRKVTASLGSVSPTGKGSGWIHGSGPPLAFFPRHRPLFQEDYAGSWGGPWSAGSLRGFYAHMKIHVYKACR